MNMFNKPAKKATRKGNGSDFLEECRKALWQVTAEYVQRGDEFNSVEEYSEALFGDLWQVADKQLRSSFRNGARDERARQRGKSE